MNTGRKKPTGLIIGLIAAVLICCCGGPIVFLFAGGSPFGGTGPSYSLAAHADQLFVQESLSEKQFIVEEGPRVPISINFDFEKFEIVVTDGDQVHRKKAGFVMDAFWSPQNQAAYYLDEIDGSTESKSQLWQWTKQGGFELIHTFDRYVDSLRDSLDGKYLYSHYTPESATAASGLEFYGIKEKSIHNIESAEPLDEAIMVTTDTFVLPGNPGVVWTPSTDKTELMNAQGQIEQCVAFHGSIWALRYDNGIYQVVKLSKDLMSFDKVVDFPTDFPKIDPNVKSED